MTTRIVVTGGVDRASSPGHPDMMACDAIVAVECLGEEKPGSHYNNNPIFYPDTEPFVARVGGVSLVVGPDKKETADLALASPHGSLVVVVTGKKAVNVARALKSEKKNRNVVIEVIGADVVCEVAGDASSAVRRYSLFQQDEPIEIAVEEPAAEPTPEPEPEPVGDEPQEESPEG